MRRVARSVALVAVLVLAAMAPACSDDGGSRTLDLSGSGSDAPTTETGSGSGSGSGSVQKWIGVLRVEADPHDLSADTADVLAIVGGAIAVSPVACFEGLPADLPLDAYLLGVTASTKEELDGLLADVDRTVLFEGQVRTMCLD
jgi:hypothetical protein